jgi:carboxypeptidase Q
MGLCGSSRDTSDCVPPGILRALIETICDWTPANELAAGRAHSIERDDCQGMTAADSFDWEQARVDVDRAIHASEHGARLMRTLCREVGPRPAGSVGMRRAIQVVTQALLDLGASNVHTEDVPIVAWDDGGSAMEVLESAPRAFDSLQAPHSGSGVCSGRLVDAGDGSLAEVGHVGGSLQSAIALMAGRSVGVMRNEPVARRIRLLEDAGAVGAIVVSSHPELPEVCWLGARNGVAIPVLGVSGRDGAELAERARSADVSVRLEARGQGREAICQNLVADLGPAGESREVIVLGAHFDSFHLAPGAFDNLSGVVTMVVIAGALAPLQERFVRKLQIITYTAEELGEYAGSRAYVRARAAELDRIRFALNLDSLFDGTALGFGVMWSPPMRDYIARTLEKRHPEVEVRNLFCMSSDYLPFMLQGIPTGRPANWHSRFPRWSHTWEDTGDKVTPAWLKSNAAVCAQTLLAMLVDRAPLPGARLTPDQVRRLLRLEAAEDDLFNWNGFSEESLM